MVEEFKVVISKRGREVKPGETEARTFLYLKAQCPWFISNLKDPRPEIGKTGRIYGGGGGPITMPAGARGVDYVEN